MSDPTSASTRELPSSEVRFDYRGEPVAFKSVDRNDHIIRDMQRRGTFYESDVLERLGQLLQKRPKGVSIDAGAFIGSHSVYFARFCGLKPVLAFEANPDTFPLLLHNIQINNLADVVIPMNRALGASPGYGHVIPGGNTNQGHSSVSLDGEKKGASVCVCTVDDEVAALLKEGLSIALIKIDVEGAELEVLRGARRTITEHTPLLSIEVHSFRNLRRVLSLLRRDQYWIIDCLGYSPTYIIESTNASSLKRLLVNVLWLLRAAVPANSSRRGHRVKRRLRNLAQKFTMGWRDVDHS